MLCFQGTCLPQSLGLAPLKSLLTFFCELLGLPSEIRPKALRLEGLHMHASGHPIFMSSPVISPDASAKHLARQLFLQM